MTKTVLIRGGAGYVGSHCGKAFARAGWNVVTPDNLYRGNRDAVRWGPLIECDIRNSSEVCAALKKYGPELVVHFAAFAYVGESVADPAAYYGNNTAATLFRFGFKGPGGWPRSLFFFPLSTSPKTAFRPCSDRPASTATTTCDAL